MTVLASHVVVVGFGSNMLDFLRLYLSHLYRESQSIFFAVNGQTDRRNFNSIRDHTNGRPCTPVDELVNVYSVIQS